jgi:hypothetical protein
MARRWSSDKSAQLLTEIEGLKMLSAAELDQRWQTLFGSARPPRIYGALLRGVLAYRLQESTVGGLKVSTRRLLRQVAGNAAARRPTSPLPRTQLKAGTVLIREWHGGSHRVTVLDKGFRFSGQRFGSLSAIARKITGSRWSGPLFFGLKASSASEANHGAK